MVPAGEDPDLFLCDLVNEPVFLIYSARPATLHFMLQWFGLANSSERITMDFLYQANNPERLIAILLNPPR
jgi:hypothetical protein